MLSDEKATISDIILTHWHYDHIGGVKEVLQCLDNAEGDLLKVESFFKKKNYVYPFLIQIAIFGNIHEVMQKIHIQSF